MRLLLSVSVRSINSIFLDLYPIVHSISKSSSSMPYGVNVFLPVHNDMDFFYSTTTLIKTGQAAMNDGILNSFCFLEQLVYLALINYDILLFNPQKLHCVSSCKNPPNVQSNDVYCVSFYLKTVIVGGNNNNFDLTVEQGKRARSMLNLKKRF
jgi:hypothetical protein